MTLERLEMTSPGMTGERHSDAGSRIVELSVKDRFSANRYRAERGMVNLFSAGLNLYLRMLPGMSADSRLNLARYLLRLTPSLRMWSRLMPGGFATYYVHNPDRRRIDNGRPLDPMAQMLFRHSHDGRGIRSRAQVMAWFMRCHLGDLESIRWVSIASGTGQPTFDAGESLTPSLTHLLIDNDRDALDFAVRLAGTYGKADGTVSVECLNVLAEADHTDVLIKDFAPHCIDAMGLVEYLKEDEIIALVGRLHHVLKPGGVLIFTNMRPTHPNLDIHKRAVCWPGVRERSEQTVERLILASGISPEEITIMLPGDQVYGIYGVVKKETSGEGNQVASRLPERDEAPDLVE